MIRSRRTERRFLHFVKIATKSRMNMYSSGILRNISSSPCPNAPQNKARPARTARREKPHTMGSMTPRPPPPPLFPAPQAFSPGNNTSMRTGTLLTDDGIDRPVRTDGSFPSQRAIRGGIPASFRGIGQTFPGTLTGPEKCNTELRSRTFGSRNPVLRISKKALCLQRTVAALIAVTVAISVTTVSYTHLTLPTNSLV